MTKNKLFKTITASISMMAFSIPFLSISSQAANTYFIRSVLDEGSFGIVTQIIADNGENPAETGKGVNYHAIQDYKDVYKDGNIIADFTNIESRLKDYVKDNNNKGEASEDSGNIGDALTAVDNAATSALDSFLTSVVYADFIGEGDNNKGLVFSFPGIIKSNHNSYYRAKSSDAQRAELVGNTLSKGLNDALLFIKTYSGVENISEDGLRHILAKLCQTAQFPNIKKFGFNTGQNAGRKGFSVNLVTDSEQKMDGSPGPVKTELIPVNGLKYSDYLRISTTDSNGKIVYGYFPWRMEKGYYPNQDLASIVGEEYAQKAKEGMENEFITWGQLIIQAALNADFGGLTNVDSVDDAMTLIGQGLGSDLTSTIGSVRSILNLAPIQELVLNMGSRSVTHHYGVMTQNMYQTAQKIYVLTMLVSLLALSSLVIKMIHQRMSATINIGSKISLMEGFKDLCFISVMLMFFPALFELMLELNFYIVKTFSFSSEFLQAYSVTNAKVLGMQSLAGFVISSMFLSIDAYINVVYLIRAITCSFLFAISPVITISYAWGSTQKKLYVSYLRELVGNIFMQSFHAVTMCFFASYNTSNLSSLEAIAATYSFVPITQLFRSLVIGSQGGFSEQIGGKLAGQLTNTAFGVQKSGVALKQAKQLAKTNADNQAMMAKANLKTSALGIMVDAGANSLINNSIDSELGRRSSSGITSGGRMGVSKGTHAKNTAIGAGAALLSGAVGYGVQKNASQDSARKLGELQMNHNMENMGIGLAQAGVGMGVSSYDSAGGGIANAGIGGVEKAAGEYGGGQGLRDNASTIGHAAGMERVALVGGSTLRGVTQSGFRGALDLNRQRKEYNEQVGMTGLDIDRGEGGSMNQTANYFLKAKDGQGFGNKEGQLQAPLIKMDKHDYINDTVSIGLDVNKLDNLSSDDAIGKLSNLVKGKVDPSTEEFKEAWKEASQKAGVSMHSVPRLSKDGNMVMMEIEGISKKLGVSIDSRNQVYSVNSLVHEKGFRNRNNGENINNVENKNN